MSNLPNTALCGDLILETALLALHHRYFVQLVDVRVRVQIKIVVVVVIKGLTLVLFLFLFLFFLLGCHWSSWIERR